MTSPESSITELINNHIEKGRKELLANEKERILILDQCGKDSNVLYADFRADLICLSYSRFRELGITLHELFALQDTIPVIYAWNVEYDVFRQDVNRRFNVFPLMIVMARKSKHVLSAYKFARKYNIPVATRSGSHSFEGFSLGEGMIIDQSRRTRIRVNAEKQQTIVEPGVLLGPLADELYKRKLVLPSGTCPNNCISGFVLGGGLGYLTRKYGVTSDSLISIKIMLADGSVIIADECNHPELFWANRGGGGGNFGIVLSLKFRVYPIDNVYVFNFVYPFDKLATVIKIWQQTALTYPNDLSAELRVTGNKGDVFVTGQYLGNSKKLLYKLLTPYLSEEPKSSEIKEVPYIEAVKYFADNGRWLPFFKTKNAFIDKPFSDTGLDIIVDFMSRGNQNNSLTLEMLGGRNNEIPSDATAFPYRAGTLGWLLINSQWTDQSVAVQELLWTTVFYDTLQPHLSDKVYVNAPDLMLKNYLEKYYANNLPRLVKIKKHYDPENIFSYPQSIPTSL